MGVFDRQTATALRLIAKNGETCIWRSREPTGTNPARDTGSTNTPHTVKVAFFPLTKEYLDTFLSHLKDTEIPTGVILGLMGRVDFVPDQNDTLVRKNGEVYSIVRDNGIEVIDPNGEGVILYTIRFTR